MRARMNVNNMDWEQFAKQLMWDNVVTRKNEDSGYDMIIAGPNKGDIGAFRILSYYIGPFVGLTWKRLALELGLFKDHLIHDGHDCSKCRKADTCKAFFKDDKDHEVCGWWTEHFCVPKEGRLFRRHNEDFEVSMSTMVEVKDLNEIKEILTACFPEGHISNIHISENGYEDLRLRGRWGINSENYARQYKVLADFDKYKNQCIGYTNFYDE